MSNYLLEVGVEEFPAKYIKSTQNQFKNYIEKSFNGNNFSFESLSINSTPRRFSILIKNIKNIEMDNTELVKGPSRKIAFDSQGNPSRALQGFLKSKNVELKDIVYHKLNGEDYIFAKIIKDTLKLDELLKKEIPHMIKSISNPRQMRWGGKNLRFLRPIRWIVSLLDDKVLDFDLEGIKVSNITKGHRTLGKPEIEICSIDEYEKKLEQNYVIVSEEKRRQLILRGINRLSKEKGGHYLENEELLEEVIQINEYPTPFIGEFDNEYLALPKEVVITPMMDHQRYFPVLDDEENLLPYFISVRNGDNKGIENVAEGNKKVLLARLEDAKFFYNKDISKNLEDYIPELEKVGYHEGLGNMLDKTQRLQKLVVSIGQNIECGNDAIEIASRAAKLSKADLVTSTVIEFTELQGIMGKIFAYKSGENSLVAKAIEEQYMPVKSGAELPSTTSGTLLSLSDKFDTISGLHSKGIEVTGSQDMYGQRRAVLGILNILITNRINVNIRQIIKDALYNYVESFGQTFDFEEVVEKLFKFIKIRFRNLLLDEGFRYDIIDAVLATENDDIFEMYKNINLLDEKSKLNYNFDDLISKFVRVINISSKAEKIEINESIFTDDDKNIYYKVRQVEQVNTLKLDGKINAAFDLLSEIVIEVDKYLDNTHVNSDDEAIKTNRLSIIKILSDKINELFNPTEIVR
ncbi:glycine--tRNA ligase subunit beta [Helcococcus ovis]|uniref:Glycine--tRNA ligase beta subunit n=2 Tax=Helcococcus ovis TaxID=72026 RepID=A0A4R9C0C9_9FIRM|nr:glycine--tRNA ligase subunit beta [Helcococcus ovis]TFF64795.1 glycine--tRNA ligase subunit beta [Helcococcus ovis]TFF65910.1 glycine--tRNA ligase subunit beta [Helcococcus ovis]TFF67197.1 glycine--tRNA ligase subunit beta [Helcococcus ovis]WNZ01020.1 glycine--tRNA ligase subunit beta [Helcococcus ovis]